MGMKAGARRPGKPALHPRWKKLQDFLGCHFLRPVSGEGASSAGGRSAVTAAISGAAGVEVSDADTLWASAGASAFRPFGLHFWRPDSEFTGAVGSAARLIAARTSACTSAGITVTGVIVAGASSAEISGAGALAFALGVHFGRSAEGVAGGAASTAVSAWTVEVSAGATCVLSADFALAFHLGWVLGSAGAGASAGVSRYGRPQARRLSHHPIWAGLERRRRQAEQLQRAQPTRHLHSFSASRLCERARRWVPARALRRWAGDTELTSSALPFCCQALRGAAVAGCCWLGVHHLGCRLAHHQGFRRVQIGTHGFRKLGVGHHRGFGHHLGQRAIRHNRST